MFRYFVFFFSMTFMLFVSPAFSEESSWGWFVAMSNINKWSTETGNAFVSITKNDFSAKLMIGNELRHELKGSIKNNKIMVLMSTNDTDLENYPLQGHHTRTIWKEESETDSAGRETIELTGAGIVVGLTREISKSSNNTLKRDATKDRRAP